MKWQTLTTVAMLGIFLPASLLNYTGAQTVSAQTLGNVQVAQTLYGDRLNQLLHGMEQSRDSLRNYALNQARQISIGYDVEWRDAVPQIILSDRVLRVTLYGKLKIPVLRDKDIRLTLDFQPDANLRFHYVDPFNLHISRCGLICKKKENML